MYVELHNINPRQPSSSAKRNRQVPDEKWRQKLYFSAISNNANTSPGRFSELLSLALGAAIGVLLADTMTAIHSWTELLDLLVFWR
ncbi:MULTISPECIES: hypothetical protein [unclassified Corynebacterium]|uniref:hypothetical protein n=1 Tax=unclassified Corynebacterium TaxID=2624378 RepID=UPI0034CF65FE